MSEHTKGELYQGTDPRGIISDAGVIVCTVSGALSHRDVLGDARRLVACWNAFDGVSTENIEANIPVKELADKYNAVLRQRDQLLEALKASRREMWRLLDAKGIDPEAIRSWPEIVQIDAAIAAAERGEL